MNRKLQKEIMDRDKVCVLCGSDKGLDVHHFNDFVPGKGFISAYETEVPELLDVLCSDCHGSLNGASGKKKYQTRRELILYKFQVELPVCQRHLWIHPGEITYCENCTITKLAFDMSRITARKVDTLFKIKGNREYPKSPIEKVKL